MAVAPLTIGAVHVALAGEDGAILPGTDRVVAFNRMQGATLSPRAPLLSDPIDLPVKPLTRLTISIHLPQGAATPTVHAYAAATNWIAPGDQTAAIKLTGATTIGPRLILSAVEVETARPAPTIVTLGDSITDGVRGAGLTCWPNAARRRGGGMSRSPMPGSAPTASCPKARAIMRSRASIAMCWRCRASAMW